MTAVFLIMIHVSVPMDRDYFVRPLEAKYQQAYAVKANCDAAARPLARVLKGKLIASVLVKGVVCLSIEVNQ